MSELTGTTDSVTRIVPVPEGVVVEDGTELAGKTWEVLRRQRAALGLNSLEVVALERFLPEMAVDTLSREEKENIIDQAILMFEHLYPHLPFKQKSFEFAHPVETLEEIRGKLDTLSDADFHSWMIVACGFVVDEHTLYGAPAPFRDAMAFLPFQLRVYRDEENFPRFAVTQVMRSEEGGGFGHSFFVPGAEVTHWNGSTADFYIENTRGRFPAGNYRAGIARGAINSTSRPLTYCQVPEERVATIHYIPPGSSQTRAIKFPWAVAKNVGTRTGFPRSAFSVSEFSTSVRVMERMMDRGLGLSPFLFQPTATPTAAASLDLEHVSVLPSIFNFQYTGGSPGAGFLDPGNLRDEERPDAKFGYIRIRAFEGQKPGINEPIGTNEMVGEFQRILADVMSRKAPDGLVLDIRGNTGGDIHAAERMLQMLTDGRIMPSFFHLANTPMVQRILRLLRDQSADPLAFSLPEQVQLSNASAQLQPWIDSVETSAASNDVLTVGHILTPTREANSVGRIYHGPCVLLIDALCYSSAEIFAAGFQDHRIGTILGVDPNTGGGGGNVWSHEDILKFLPATEELPLKPLPPGVTLSLAIRRHTRFQRGFGPPVEDHGVIADVHFPPSSVADLLDGFTGAVRRACKLLGASRDTDTP